MNLFNSIKKISLLIPIFNIYALIYGIIIYEDTYFLFCFLKHFTEFLYLFIIMHWYQQFQIYSLEIKKIILHFCLTSNMLEMFFILYKLEFYILLIWGIIIELEHLLFNFSNWGDKSFSFYNLKLPYIYLTKSWIINYMV